jgi:hypothetical protein
MKPWQRLTLPAALALAALAALAPAAAAEELRLTARETRTLDYPGAIAAFAVDPSTVEASALDSRVVLLARRAGQTVVTVVLPTSTLTLNVKVEPGAPMLPPGFVDPSQRQGGVFEARYDSAAHRASSGVAAEFGKGETKARLRLEAVHEKPDGDRGKTALPVASIEIETPDRKLVLLDQRVQASPLTVDGAVLRGAHLEQGPLQVHAGVASATPYDDFLLPGDGDRAVGAAWHTRRGGLGLIPAFYWFPDSGTPVPAVASLGITAGADGDALSVRGELGWSGRPGASIDLDYRDGQRQAWLRAAYRPAGFAALRVARPAGSYADAAWSEHLGPDTNASLSLSFNRLELEGSRPEAASARLDLRHQLDANWSLNAGVGGGAYRDPRTQMLRRSALSMGGAYDSAGFGVSALYRYQQTSASGQAGHGGRLSLRGAGSGWKANLFADVQQQAPTLDLVLQDRSGLARALTELGLASANPEETLRQLRDNAGLLSARGISLGALRLDPLRVQAGLDVSWRGSGLHVPEIGLRLLADDSQGVTGGRRNLLATLYAGWRFTRDTELIASYSRWTLRGDGLDGGGSGSFQLALRTRFSELGMPGEGSRTIAGQVLLDEAAGGSAAAGRQPLAGIEVVLDRSRRTRSDRDGHFSFERPGSGGHRVEAILPPQPGAYFTQPSVLTLQPGSEASFALTFSAARLAGTVRSDAGVPLAGVAVRLEGSSPATTTTDSSGAFRFAGPPGEVSVTVVAETLPPGYELGKLAAQRSRLSPAEPAVADFTVRAQRVIEGVVAGTEGRRVTVRAQDASRPVVSDTKGRFILRGLPAGPVTLRVRNERGETRQVVEMPAEPGRVRDIQLAAP